MKKRMELPQKMRFKILILCLACTMTALLLQTWLFNRKSSTLIYNQAKKESFSLLRNMQDDLFTILKSMENNIIKVYNPPAADPGFKGKGIHFPAEGQVLQGVL